MRSTVHRLRAARVRRRQAYAAQQRHHDDAMALMAEEEARKPDPLVCEVCGQRFKSEAGVKVHKTRKH